MRRACDNPFAVHRVLRERYRMDDAPWARVLERLDRLGRRAAIVGPHGSGKTTLLEDLGARLGARGWRIHFLRFDTERRSLPALPTWTRDDFVLCDGAEQLSYLDWSRLRWRSFGAGGLVITTHRAGRLPTLHRCETSPALLGELALSLGAPLSLSDTEALYARSTGNLRDAIRFLYDRWSREEATMSRSHLA